MSTLSTVGGRPMRRSSAQKTNTLTMAFIFVAGFLGGHFHGHFLQSSLQQGSDLVETRQKQDGWSSIQVFYGSKKELDGSKDQDLQWFSQAGQDQIVMALLKGKRNGYFIDLAANDATHLSNTYILERDFDWTGLCIEPNPIYWERLALLRHCQIVAAVVGSTRLEPVHFRFTAGDHGGIAGVGFDNGPRWRNESSVRYTVRLDEILEQNHAPQHIDYLSLDVEGAEEFIMKDFDFKRYHISILTTERPSDPLRDLLAQQGFRNLVRLTRWGEVMWVHESVFDSLDKSILDRIDDIKAFYKNKYT